MTEPNDFSPIEQLQDCNKKVANKIVREYFRDVTALEADLDLTTPRQALLKACLHREDDSLLVSILRNQVFYNFCPRSAAASYWEFIERAIGKQHA